MTENRSVVGREGSDCDRTQGKAGVVETYRNVIILIAVITVLSVL